MIKYVKVKCIIAQHGEDQFLTMVFPWHSIVSLNEVSSSFKGKAGFGRSHILVNVPEGCVAGYEVWDELDDILNQLKE